MQRLNIPLSRSLKTTRRSRRVVWFLGGILLGACLGTYAITGMWLMHPRIYELAPEGTVMVVRLQTAGKSGQIIGELLKNMSLVTDRSVTFADLAPYLQGELALFISETGTLSVGIQSTQLPESFQAKDVFIQNGSGNRRLITAEPVETHPSQAKSSWRPWPSLFMTRLGEIYETNNDRARHTIYANTDRVEIRSFGPENTETFSSVPKGTYAYLSNTYWTNEVTPFLNSFFPIQHFFADDTIAPTFSQLLSASGTLILTEQNGESGYYLTSHPQKPLDIPEFLKSISALQNPQLVETTLEDESVIKEFIADPDHVSVEQISVLGKATYRVSGLHQQLFAGTSDDNALFFTNQETLLRATQDKNEQIPIFCQGNAGGINVNAWQTAIESSRSVPAQNPLFLLAHTFSSIGFKHTVFSNKILLCREPVDNL